ncbi:salicylate synthase [Pseudoroseomonas sp. WGS1072]|uniref:salicylate synthase n=1 Tax=Roseomonas sp. WGS1072 TaxID=3366816 RepID=UPI003BF3461E
MQTYPSLWPEAFAQRYESLGYWQAETLGQALRRWAAAQVGRIAVTEGDRQITYAALDARVNRLAGGLQKLGLRRGDRVLVQMPNSIAFVAASFALFRLGAVPIFAMPAQRINDLDALCGLAEPVACIIADQFLGFDYRPMAAELMARHASLRHVLVDGDAGPHRLLSSVDAPFDDSVQPHHRDIACLLLSGGTTGTPKLIPRTHADYAFNARASAELCGLTEDSVYLAALPAAHNFTLCCPGIIGTLGCGGRVVIAKTPGGDETFPLITREKVTITSLVPSLANLWLQQREWDDTDLSSLDLLQVGGARLMPDLARRITPELGCGLQQVFGMAEGLLCFTRPDDPLEAIINTEGRPLCPDDELRIVDADGRDVPDGMVGELLVRGPYTIRGYYRAEAHNRTAFTPDGFYRSGDLVRRRVEDSNIVVEGRIKEQINRAGEKIATAEIEEHLRSHPDVADAVLLGLPDAQLGERSCAVLITHGARPDLASIHAHLRARGLPRYKLPDQIGFAASWPLTAIGKIDRRRLATAQMPAPSYREVTVPIATEPLLLAALLGEAGLAPCFTAYERDGEWSLGIGSVAEIVADAARVTLRQGDHTRDWPAADLPLALEAALAALPLRGWRAYGMAEFELSRLFHGLPARDAARPLLQLHLPEYEIRLRHGTALLRATDEAGLARARAALQGAEARATEDGEDVLARRRADHAMPVPALAMAGAARYRQGVASAVAEIAAGDYDKVILSRAVPLPAQLDLSASYVAGRRANRPARSFLLFRSGFGAAGFSPETVVEVDAAGCVSTQPLAGTRALGADEGRNAELTRELLRDPKEVAEHAVSVKLAFEELEPICAEGSVAVSEFMAVARRGSVQHLASRLGGRLRQGRSAWHAFQALFPAVTASGIPKQKAIEAIARHEDAPRGLYSGCVLVADQDGALDAALVLRALYRDGERCWLQAGAGIVGLSTPERELEETCEKLTSVARNLVALPQQARAPGTLEEV